MRAFRFLDPLEEPTVGLVQYEPNHWKIVSAEPAGLFPFVAVAIKPAGDHDFGIFAKHRCKNGAQRSKHLSGACRMQPKDWLIW